MTSSAESSSAIFWCGANVLSVIFVEVSQKLSLGILLISVILTLFRDDFDAPVNPRSFSNLHHPHPLKVMDALRYGDNASPPQNMKRGLIFLGVVVMILCFIPVFGLQAKQVRREADASKLAARERMRGRAGSGGTDIQTSDGVGSEDGLRPRSGHSTVPLQSTAGRSTV